ncbi:MAG TPA: tRNA glutamyl-Q(34) synthetase GluQRS [Thermoleophilaceae bacterium]
MRFDGRYAPSPTGPLHLGNLRTALLAWLFARSHSARFLLRIEDLDPQRSRGEHEAGQLADLAALGLDWDARPLRQSERGERYAEAVEQLRAQGLVYECFCTRAEIREAVSAPPGRDRTSGIGASAPALATDPSLDLYPGTCRSLSAAARAERLRAGRPPALRVRADAARVGFHDLLAGDVEAIVDDVVVRRNDGAYAYNLAVAVDDADQGIGEVVRGADLLGATAGQRWLTQRLGLTPPSRYAHVPLVLGEDGQRLAKRHGAVTLAQRLARGQSPDGIRGELAASVGLCQTGGRPSLAELLERFDAGAWAAAAAGSISPVWTVPTHPRG